MTNIILFGLILVFVIGYVIWFVLTHEPNQPEETIYRSISFDDIADYVNRNEKGKGGYNISAAQEKEVIRLVVDYISQYPAAARNEFFDGQRRFK